MEKLVKEEASDLSGTLWSLWRFSHQIGTFFNVNSTLCYMGSMGQLICRLAGFIFAMETAWQTFANSAKLTGYKRKENDTSVVEKE